MAANRFPIFVWEDYDGGVNACLLEEGMESVAAVGATAREAADQLEEYLRWSAKEGWLPEPDFHEPRLVTVKVQVRPEYQVAGASRWGDERTRVYACEETVLLRVGCVCGKDANGLLVCAMPLMGGRFTYYEPDALKGLVEHYVQTALKGLTPQQVARFLPPRSVALDELVIHVAGRARSRREDPELEALQAVAEPIGARGVRRQLSRPWERDAQVARLVERLGRERANVVLLGETGSGKTAILAEAARKAEREQPDKEGESSEGDEALYAVRNRFWLTSAARLIAGMQYLGQWQERCEEIIAQLSTIGGVLCVENLLDLVRTGGSGPGDSLAAFVLPYVQRRELRLVAEATPAELDACRRLLPGFADVFQVLSIPAFTRPQAVTALAQVARARERNLRVSIEAGAVDQIHRLFARFMPYQGFPGPASSFLLELFDQAHRKKAGAVTARAATEQFVRRTGLPEVFLRDDLPLRREEVLTTLRAQVIGQDAACEAAVDLILTFKAALNDPGRPVGVLLFCGPTGVGKTELARAVSRFFFGHGDERDRLIRLDMSEYAGPGAAERLLGSAHAALGLRGEPSPLIRRVRQQPFAVVLLDEIEKAAAEVFDVLLGVFDEGRLTDPYGRLTLFRSTVVIMTSNLGADRPESFGLGKPAAPDYDAEAMAFFRPEFFNRIDAVVRFHPLSPEAMRQIAEKELHDLANREGLARAGLRLRWTDALVDWLIARGFDRRYGARPLQRAIETLVVAPLARHLIEYQDVSSGEILLDRADGDGSAVIIRAVNSPGNESRLQM
jgi:ATP-dependent Clp protease ATP-binding subunit ClpC